MQFKNAIKQVKLETRSLTDEIYIKKIESENAELKKRLALYMNAPSICHPKALKDTIKQARENIGLSQNKVSLQTGITRNSINAYEAGRAYPNAEKIAILCWLYKTTPNDLLGFN